MADASALLRAPSARTAAPGGTERAGQGRSAHMAETHDADTESTVRRYFQVVADLDSTEDELRGILHPDAVLRELPNPIAPNGHVRTVDETVARFLAGKSKLTAQSIEILEVLVAGDRAAVRSVWRRCRPITSRTSC